MMWSRLASGIAGAVLLVGCQSQPTFNPEDPAVVAAIQSNLDSIMEGAAKADAEELLAAFDEDTTFITGDVMLSGLEEIRPRFAETYSGVASQSHTILEKNVRVLSPDVVLVMVTANGTYTDTAGWTSEPVGLAVTMVFVRRDGAWRGVHAHQSIAD